MKAKKVITVMLAAVLAMSMSGCGGNSTQQSDDESKMQAAEESVSVENAQTEAAKTEGKDSVTVTLAWDPNTLAPNGNSTVSGGFTASQIYDQLWNLTDGELVMRVATGYEKEDDTHYIITIQSGIKDTAGNDIKASDVLFSLELAKNGSQGFPGAVRYVDVENSEVIDDTTLRVAFTQPCSFQLNSLSMVNLVSQASYEASSDGMVTTPVGSGPYMLSEYVTGSYVKMDYNPDYWGGGDPAIKHVTVNFVSEASQRANVMLTGESDYAWNLAYTDAGAMENAEGITFTHDKNLGTFVLLFNNSSSSVCGGNLELRKAIAYAINQDAVVAASAGGYGEVSKCCTSTKYADYSEDFVEISADTDYYAYNVEAAKEALAASGIPEGTTLKLANGAMAEQDAIAQTIQANLAEIGLNVEISNYPDTQAQVITNQPEDWDISINSLSLIHI